MSDTKVLRDDDRFFNCLMSEKCLITISVQGYYHLLDVSYLRKSGVVIISL